MSPDTTVSLLAEIPDDLHQRVQAFLSANPGWNYDDFVASALSLLLFQLAGDKTREAMRSQVEQLLFSCRTEP
jgi:hypothetical protein